MKTRGKEIFMIGAILMATAFLAANPLVYGQDEPASASEDLARVLRLMQDLNELGVPYDEMHVVDTEGGVSLSIPRASISSALEARGLDPVECLSGDLHLDRMETLLADLPEEPSGPAAARLDGRPLIDFLRESRGASGSAASASGSSLLGSPAGWDEDRWEEYLEMAEERIEDIIEDIERADSRSELRELYGDLDEIRRDLAIKVQADSDFESELESLFEDSVEDQMEATGVILADLKDDRRISSSDLDKFAAIGSTWLKGIEDLEDFEDDFDIDVEELSLSAQTEIVSTTAGLMNATGERKKRKSDPFNLDHRKKVLRAALRIGREVEDEEEFAELIAAQALVPAMQDIINDGSDSDESLDAALRLASSAKSRLGDAGEDIYDQVETDITNIRVGNEMSELDGEIMALSQQAMAEGFGEVVAVYEDGTPTRPPGLNYPLLAGIQAATGRAMEYASRFCGGSYTDRNNKSFLGIFHMSSAVTRTVEPVPELCQRAQAQLTLIQEGAVNNGHRVDERTRYQNEQYEHSWNNADEEGKDAIRQRVAAAKRMSSSLGMPYSSPGASAPFTAPRMPASGSSSSLLKSSSSGSSVTSPYAGLWTPSSG